MKEDDIIDGHPALPHEFFDIMIAQGMTEIPRNRTEDHFVREMTLFEGEGVMLHPKWAEVSGGLVPASDH
jgi:hypothetical protein